MQRGGTESTAVLNASEAFSVFLMGTNSRLVHATSMASEIPCHAARNVFICSKQNVNMVVIAGPDCCK